MLRVTLKYVLPPHPSLVAYGSPEFYVSLNSEHGKIFIQVKGLDVDSLIISHIQVNQAQKQRRRTYRAHGRINRTVSKISNKTLFCFTLEHYIPYVIEFDILFCSLYVISMPH